MPKNKGEEQDLFLCLHHELKEVSKHLTESIARMAQASSFECANPSPDASKPETEETVV